MKWLMLVAVIAMSVSCFDRTGGTDEPVDSAPGVEVPVPADTVIPDTVMARDTARLPAER